MNMKKYTEDILSLKETINNGSNDLKRPVAIAFTGFRSYTFFTFWICKHALLRFSFSTGIYMEKLSGRASSYSTTNVRQKNPISRNVGKTRRWDPNFLQPGCSLANLPVGQSRGELQVGRLVSCIYSHQFGFVSLLSTSAIELDHFAIKGVSSCFDRDGSAFIQAPYSSRALHNLLKEMRARFLQTLRAGTSCVTVSRFLWKSFHGENFR